MKGEKRKSKRQYYTVTVPGVTLLERDGKHLVVYEGMEFPETFATRAGLLPLSDVKTLVTNYARALNDWRGLLETVEKAKALARLLDGKPSRSSRVRRLKSWLREINTEIGGYGSEEDEEDEED